MLNIFLKNLRFTLISCLGFSALIILNGCSSSSHFEGIERPSRAPLYAKRGTYKIGNPYTIKGVTYSPRETFHFEETGLASWYGPGFHEKTTANMEIFDQNQISAAHKTLQLPCLIRVHNLDNGRVLDVRVNDRGPFYDGRILDLSKRAAQLLGVFQKGLARVHIKVLEHESRLLKEMALGKRPSQKKPAPLPVETVDIESIKPLPYVDPFKESVFTSEPLPIQKGGDYIDLPLIKDYREAAKLSAKMEKFGRSSIAQEKVGKDIFYKVQIGPFSNWKEAEKVLKAVKGKGFSKALITATK
ncbi:MAG: septal ring lytic transglycosylase RlpA family protein [Proteobacteria bacterium]|nr:septal ring lytic transglycosylase RlpA family protein [Pseudomonadota bacterium]